MAQHLGRRRVPQDMCAFGRAHDPSPLHRASHRGGYAVASLERPVRSNVSNEDVVAVSGRRPACEIVQDRVSNVLRERQSNLVAPLPGDPQCAGLPLDIADAKPRDIAGSKPEPCQEQNDCPITPACRRTAVTCGDQAGRPAPPLNTLAVWPSARRQMLAPPDRDRPGTRPWALRYRKNARKPVVSFSAVPAPHLLARSRK